MAARTSLPVRLFLGLIILLGWGFVGLGGSTLVSMRSDPETPWYFEGAIAVLTVAMASLLVILLAMLRRDARDCGAVRFIEPLHPAEQEKQPRLSTLRGRCRRG